MKIAKHLNDEKNLVRKYKEHSTEVKIDYKNKTIDQLEKEATFFNENKLMINELKCLTEIKKKLETRLNISEDLNEDELE